MAPSPHRYLTMPEQKVANLSRPNKKGVVVVGGVLGSPPCPAAEILNHNNLQKGETPQTAVPSAAVHKAASKDWQIC